MSTDGWGEDITLPPPLTTETAKHIPDAHGGTQKKATGLARGATSGFGVHRTAPNATLPLATSAEHSVTAMNSAHTNGFVASVPTMTTVPPTVDKASQPGRATAAINSIAHPKEFGHAAPPAAAGFGAGLPSATRPPIVNLVNMNGFGAPTVVATVPPASNDTRYKHHPQAAATVHSTGAAAKEPMGFGPPATRTAVADDVFRAPDATTRLANMVRVNAFGVPITPTPAKTPNFVFKSNVSNGHIASTDSCTTDLNANSSPLNGFGRSAVDKMPKEVGEGLLKTAWGIAGMAQAKNINVPPKSPDKPASIGFGAPPSFVALSPANQFARQPEVKEDEEKGPSRGCFNCGEHDHFSNECPHPRKKITCFNCGQEGHRSGDCHEPFKHREDVARPPSIFVPKEVDVDQLYKTGVPKGAMFEKLFDAKVQTMRSGLEPEKPEEIVVFESFEDLFLSDKIAQNVTRSGYSKPTPVQKHTMPVIMNGLDLLACAQTGSGKTAAYLLPIMSKLLEEKDYSTAAEYCIMPRCLIIAPTRELARQIYNECRKFGWGTIIECRVVHGGVSVSHQRQELNKRGSIVVGTTGRLLQFIQEGAISLAKIRFLVLDEADRMLDMGFGDDIRAITTHKDMPGTKQRQTLMFSATFPTLVQQQARLLLKGNYQMITIDAIGTANKCISQYVIPCEAAEKKDKLLELLNIDIRNYTVDKESDVFSKKTLIFVSKKAFADCLGSIVCMAGISATTIHSDRLQFERHEAMEEFASGMKPVMIATAVAERGLDIKGVDHVINYDMPDKIDDYVHRIGRTGRVGNPGRATSLYVNARDHELAVGLKKCMEDAGQIVPDWLTAEASSGSGQGGAQEEESW